jgi:uncharacterized protein (TIGR02996 family)
MATAKTKAKAKAVPKDNATSALEKAIEKAPDAPDAYLVYADHLTEIGDPLGELISVQAQIASATAAKKKKTELAKLTRREKELLAAHENDWLGSIAQISKGGARTNPFTGVLQHFPPRPGPVLRFGFIESMRAFGVDELEELLSLRLAKFIRNLEIQFPFEQMLPKLLKLGVPRTLRRLAFVLGDMDQLSWTQLGDLSVLYPKLKQLEELQITVGIMDLGAINLPALKSFEVITGGLTRANVRSIASAKWPKLERLSIYFGSSEYGADARVTDLKPILKGDGSLKRLKHLGLCNSEFADDIAKAIVNAPIVKQLETLDLSKGTMSDTGAELLIQGASKLKHLKRIDLSKNFFTLEAQEELEETFKKLIDLSDQGDGDEDYRYVQVSE